MNTKDVPSSNISDSGTNSTNDATVDAQSTTSEAATDQKKEPRIPTPVGPVGIGDSVKYQSSRGLTFMKVAAFAKDPVSKRLILRGKPQRMSGRTPWTFAETVLQIIPKSVDSEADWGTEALAKPVPKVWS